MKFMSKIAFIGLLFVSQFASSAFAQADMLVKTGDELVWSTIDTAATGRDGVEGAPFEERAFVKIDAANGERSYRYQNRSRTVLRKNKYFALLQRGDAVTPEEELINALPEKLVSGEKWKITTYALARECGKLRYDYTAIVSEGPEVTVSVKGNPTQVKTFQVYFDGTWGGGNVSCGSGTAYLKFLYAPALGELVFNESRYFYKGMVTKGRKITLRSVE